VEQVRKLITQHQFNNELLRILNASLASGLRNTDSFIAATLQKHLFREMKVADMSVRNPENMRWNTLNKRWVSIVPSKSTEVEAEGGDEDDEVEGDVEGEGDAEPTKDKAPLHGLPSSFNPVIMAIYGQICVAAKSYQSAICTFFLFL